MSCIFMFVFIYIYIYLVVYLFIYIYIYIYINIFSQFFFFLGGGVWRVESWLGGLGVRCLRSLPRLSGHYEPGGVPQAQARRGGESAPEAATGLLLRIRSARQPEPGELAVTGLICFFFLWGWRRVWGFGGPFCRVVSSDLCRTELMCGPFHGPCLAGWTRLPATRSISGYPSPPWRMRRSWPTSARECSRLPSGSGKQMTRMHALAGCTHGW